MLRSLEAFHPEAKMGLIPEEIEAHYRQSREAERLSNEWGELERVRTQAILARYLPPAPAVVLDVGGAAGVYAIPLAKQGYAVHLIDPVPLHLEQARTNATAAGARLASVTHGDARQLDFAANSADAVLLLGPLYHLIEKTDRIQSLREARRILKPQGFLFAAAISRFASLVDGLARGFFQDAEFRRIVEGDLAQGVHRNPTDRIEYFTSAYFHRPEELSAEVELAGLGDVRIFAVEGPVWSAAHFRDAWNDPAQQQELLEFLAIVEAEPSIAGASGHMIAVARRPA